MSKFIAALSAFFMLMASTAAAQTTTLLPLRLVTPAWLDAHRRDANLVIIQVEMGPAKSVARIPGARLLAYRSLIVERDGLSTELSAPEQLRATFEALGVSDSSLVVVMTAHEAPMAARALLSLEYLGHTRLAWLDGGMQRWQAERRAVTTDSALITRGRISTLPRTDLVVSSTWITERMNQPGVTLIDTRTDGEYIGAGERHGMPSDGHLGGARQLEWEQLFVPNTMQLKPRAELAALYRERMRTGDTVVTYCWIGYRASMTYVAARILGLPARFYDGSYQDWQQRKQPVTAGSTP